MSRDNMKPFHTIIVDKFLENPNLVRKLALSQKYFESPKGIYSGVRTRDLKEICPDLSNKIAARVLNLYGENPDNYVWSSYFHVTGKAFGEVGWVHSDSPGISAVIYLNPGIRHFCSGTSLYNTKNFDERRYNKIKNLRQSFLDREDNVIDKEIHNSNYLKTIEVGGIFNRLLAYEGIHPHAGMNYFGTNIEDSRLTMLFFIESKKV